MNFTFPNRLSLAHLPTPIEKLERLTNRLAGPTIYIKRDDQTGLALGGNKTRKLEFLCADALSQGSNHLITCGSPQSNHCRQTAAAAAQLGLSCSLVFAGKKPTELGGNLLIDRIMGANRYWIGDRDLGEAMEEIAKDVHSAGATPYIISRGGSTGLGALGYVLAMKELTEQFDRSGLMIDLIVLASSSGGTQAGVVLGKELFNFQGSIIGISIDAPANQLQHEVSTIANDSAIRLGVTQRISPAMVAITDDYLGEGYGIVGDLEREAIRLFAKLEGILLDPVYTGRAAGALIREIRNGHWQGQKNILFWHTGGTPALFAYADELK